MKTKIDKKMYRLKPYKVSPDTKAKLKKISKKLQKDLQELPDKWWEQIIQPPKPPKGMTEEKAKELRKEIEEILR